MTTTIDATDMAWGWTIFENARTELAARVRMHPFVMRCDQGRVSFNELRNFLVQHGRYAGYFTRYLCALISQLEDSGDVLHLAQNLVEELGYGSDGQMPHSRIYSSMLEEFGITREAQPTFPETQHLIDTMFMLCRQPRGMAGLGALYLGAEAIVPATYVPIMEGLRSHDIPEQRLEFFAMHVRCDDEHAKTMRSIIERMIEDAPADAMRIVSAGELAVSARLRFFDGLSRGVP